MTITIRVPLEAYAYAEIKFDSLEEYKEKYPEVAKTIVDTRAKAKELVIKNQEPFKS